MPKERPDETPQEEKGYTPASPVKRTLAWIGLAYALLFLALTTYYFYTGSMLGNLGPLLAVYGTQNTFYIESRSYDSCAVKRISVDFLFYGFIA